MKAYARPAILVLAAITLAASVYALYVHYHLLYDPNYAALCEVSSTVSCQTVFQSSYGSVWGIPIAAGGAIWAGLVLLLAAVGMGSPDRQRADASTGYVFLLSVVGLAAVFYYGYASFVVLQSQCLVCMTMYAAIIGIFLISSGSTSMPISSLPGRLARDARAMVMSPLGAALAIAWLVGSVSLVAFFPREGPQANGAAATADGAAPAPLAVEELTADQLTEWHNWLDRQPRVPDVAPSGDVKVLLVKFNDYQCPSCRQTWVAYRDLIAKWEAEQPGAFAFETRDFPLEPECGVGGMHPGACEAAVAARLAKERGRGKEMETWLYQNQAELTRSRIKEAAESIAGVTDYDDRYDALLAEIRKDAELGERLGVSGTPTFFLNGVRMGSGVRVSYLDAAIAHELRKAQGAS
jgi:uncharacterized membrane protein/protein-disulfide isomerase